MTLLARLTFLALVVATFGAFFVTQRLKRTPPPVNSVLATPLFSPNRDGRGNERARVSFTIKKDDEVTVDVVTSGGDRIARIADGRLQQAYRRLSLTWDGRDDDGRPAKDGTYRYRVALRREGRTVTLPDAVVKDTTPPRPRVLSIGPTASTVASPEYFPNRQGEPMRVRLFVPGRAASVRVYRTDASSPQLVLERGVRPGATTWTWDATGEDGSSLPSGTYVVVARSRDKAGNVGTSPAEPPKPGYGRALGGKGGVQIASLAAGPPSGPVEATGEAEFLVVSAGRRYAWQVRRVGERDPRSDGGGTRSRVVLRAPGGKSGLYLFEVRTANRSVQVPFAVQSVRSERVLVVLPVTTWQGHNEIDDDGDGWPDTLDAGLPVRTARPYAGGALPEGVADHVGPLLAAIDRAGLRYDLTTDVALARGQGPKLAGHTGVVLAGDTTWLDAGVQRSLRTWARDGGRLLQTGIDSLRRSVRVTPTHIEEPTQATPRDLFGARLGRLEAQPGVTLTNTVDRIDLFRNTDGVFGPFDGYEATSGVGADERILAVASTPDAQHDVLVASRFGDGVVVRLGVSDFADRLSSDPELVQLLQRTWTLLRFR